jgi:hypothetical protein
VPSLWLVGVQLLRLERGRAVLLLPPPELEEPPELLLLPVDPAAQKLA